MEELKIAEIINVSYTNDPECLAVSIIFYGEDEVCTHYIRDGDEFGNSPYLRQWIADNNPEILPYIPPPEPTPEELRAVMPPISKRQLRLTLVRNGISISELDNAISQMGDEAVIEWQDATEYNRLHPLLLQVAAYLELTPEQVDVMWQEALGA